ncbi:Peptidase C1A [Trypanosoma melophagium]|uniref:Peptidase C1A n=1 Tax=Trypanosoma melophagium TaxID=715481 RepID=UPI00351A6C9B|nr:Peptidase C1A [Trypanosoma melophagium]
MNGRVSTDQSISLLERSSYIYRAANVPEAMSWQDAEKPVLSAIKNQVSCGSCWAHAATQSVESMYAIHTGKLFNLSTQQVTSCTNNSHHCDGTGGCGGGAVQLAWEYVRSAGGLTLNETYPYISGNIQKTETCQLNTSVPRGVNVYSYVTFPHNDYDAIIEALATVGPLAVSVDAGQWKNYVESIFDLCGKDGSNITINHAVHLVGYGSDNVTRQDYWIVRNSWGKDWGENGYIQLLRKKKDDICVPVEGWNTIGGGCENDKNFSITACGMRGILYDVSCPCVTESPEKAKRVWIAGVAFGALALLMIFLLICSKCRSKKPVTEVVLLDDEEESVYVKG